MTVDKLREFGEEYLSAYRAFERVTVLHKDALRQLYAKESRLHAALQMNVCKGDAVIVAGEVLFVSGDNAMGHKISKLKVIKK